ncbi:MAG: GspH/FimT family pseudopilin [Gammaproteobacteria bacterium]|nr:GspH/FimT family pseudopilin [Gammaproteobacteria bacterium]
MKSRHRMFLRGITVLEVLIALTVIAIVILVSVPGSTMVLERHRLKSASGNLSKGLSTALIEAGRRSSIVRVCPSSNGRFCRRDGDWSKGWLVFSDGNGDGIVQDIELLETFQPPNENIRITAKGAVQSMASFHTNGLVGDEASATGRFDICHLGSKAPTRIILIDEEGWVNLRTDDSSAGCGSS